MKEKVLKVLSQIMEVSITRLSEKSSAESVENWDSLRHMNLILALEEEFKVSFSDSEIVDMLSVDAILKCLNGKTKKR